jgi:predicted fused transcriptional regulator/phosphomethylpyrimidine kinase
MSDEAQQQAWLETFIRKHKGIAGSVHRRSGPDELALVATVNIPDVVKNIVMRVPRGKGMAGLALERNAAISSCNIQSDATGQVRPGARAVDAQAAVALPVQTRDGEVRAVVGIAFANERTLTDSELQALADAAAELP